MSFISMHDPDFSKFEDLTIPVAIIKLFRMSDVPKLGKYVIFGDNCIQLFNSYKFNENAKNVYRLLKQKGLKVDIVGINVYIQSI